MLVQAETETDEMFAQITLQPDPDVSLTHTGLDWTTAILVFLLLLSPLP